MNDRLFILAGLMVFIAFVTIPIWHAAAIGEAGLVPPKIKLPVQEKECVAPVSYMRAFHMHLLEDWRDSVVRSGQRKYVAYNGKIYEKNLTQTCLGACHGGRQEFCDRCHNYSGVSTLNCWQCHTDAPQLARNLP